jgi:hypothetical protein
MSFYPKDYASGIIEQKKILPVIREYFNRDITEIEAKLSPFDYECDKYFYELKTRTNTKNKYPTTLIGKNKIEGNKKTILIFKFTDCLCYIKYKKSLFDTFEIKKFDRNVKSSNKSDYIYIPVQHLKIIEFKNNRIID